MSGFVAPTPTNLFNIAPEVKYISRDLTQFEIDTLTEHERRLKYYTAEANKENKVKEEKNLFINLSIVQIFHNLSQVIISILNELMLINKDTPKSEIFLIFVKNDRLIYLGLLVVLIGLGMYIIDITD